MAYIPKSLREEVIIRAHYRCEYCQTSQEIVIEMEIDHIIPVSVGGKTEADNLCIACISCNSRKQDYQTAFDPETNEEVSLFNPRTQQWGEHFGWDQESIRIIGLSLIGRASISRLDMNRELVVSARKRWVQAGWHPPLS